MEELAKVVGPLLVGEDASTSQAALFLARDLTGKEVVLKRTAARSKQLLESAQNEVSLLRKIRHPNVVAFVGVWMRPLEPYGSEINLLVELCPGGHLLDLRRRRETAGRPLTEQEIVRLFVQACRGVECLHRFDPPVAHRDVKLENLLLGGEDGRIVKLCDFGSATTRRVLPVTKEDRAWLEDEVSRLTTPSYRAPEQVDLFSRRLVSEQVDVWALGCVLYVLAFGRHAFGEEGSSLAIINGKYVIPTEPYYSEEFKLIIFWLLEQDPNLRPRVGDVVDEMDLLLGNKIKVSAEKRGSGRGDRSASRKEAMDAFFSPGPAPKKSTPPKTSVSAAATTTTTAATSQARGAAFLATGVGGATGGASTRSGAMESRRNRVTAAANAAAAATTVADGAPQTPSPPRLRPGEQKKSTSTNPFDDLPASANPTFFSTPGLISTSVVGFPEDFPVTSPFSLPPYPSGTGLDSVTTSASAPKTDEFQRNPVTHVSSSLNFGALPPSQAPIFFSDPPPQWRPTTVTRESPSSSDAEQRRT